MAILKDLFGIIFSPPPLTDDPMVDNPMVVINRDIGVVHYALPRLLMSESCLMSISDGIISFSNQQSSIFGGGQETGYALVGTIKSDSILVKGIIEPGPKAEYSHGHVRFDRDYQQEELDKIQMVFPDIGHVGDIHLHPGNMNGCSGGDLHTDSNNVLDSVSAEMIFIIVTRAGFGSNKTVVNNHVLRLKDLQFNFYYLGKNSSYRYCPIVPHMVTNPSIKIPSGLDRYFKEHPIRAKLDFGALQKLPDHRVTVLDCDQLILQVINESLKYKLVIKHNDGCAPNMSSCS